jgi:hypothetical protein
LGKDIVDSPKNVHIGSHTVRLGLGVTWDKFSAFPLLFIVSHTQYLLNTMTAGTQEGLKEVRHGGQC